VPSIDVDDWRKHTDVRYFSPNTPTDLELHNLLWFWSIISHFKKEEQARLLQFVTGSSRVPAQGFKVCNINSNPSTT